MLFAIFNIFFTLIIIILLVRYFVERYRYYGFGPVMVAVIQITEKMVKPLRKVMPQASLKLQDQIPLLAIVVVIIIRGLFIFLLGAGTYPIFRIRDEIVGTNFIVAQAISFTMGVTLITQLLIFLLFASMMISKSGITNMSSGGFVCFQERTFAIFNFARRYFNTQNLVKLFIVCAITIWLVGAALATVTSLSFLGGSLVVRQTFGLTLLEIANGVLYYYMLVLVLAIITSWIGADRFSIVVQFVKAMSDPYLDFFRRLAPWAKIDFIDLSPIFAFLTLMIVMMLMQSAMYWTIL